MEVALFSFAVRVSGCGLFFASVLGVGRSNDLRNLGTVWREFRWIHYEFKRNLENKQCLRRKQFGS
jgi:hypothetical protein